MNIERLEMMRVMMERVVAGSWTPQFDAPLHVEMSNVSPEFVVDTMDLDTWVERVKTNAKGNTCGFSACAVGHACFDEEFRKLGWSWNGSSPVFDGDDSWTGVINFFEIRSQTAKLLFVNENYSYTVRSRYKNLPRKVREAKMVADRISLLMKIGQLDFQNDYAKPV